jgi:hypothetical protein
VTSTEPDAAPASPLAFSEQLATLVAEDGPDRLPFSRVAAELGARAWGGLLFIFGAINMLPLPPGTSTFFALPMLIVAGQMALGRSRPWFPRRLEQHGVSRQLLGQLVSKLGWLEKRIERVLRPRLPRLTGPAAARAIGAICVLLALVAAIPIPLFHVAPAAAIALFGLALIYRDGLLAIVALVAGILSVVVDILVIGSGVVALTYVAHRFGL